MKHQTRNELCLGPDGVWALPDPHEFSYSEGTATERYLEKAYRSAQDLSTTSMELERWIRDWPTRYHLSRARSNLLRPFQMPSGARVLEVGCGCGAITRFLGETFERVVSVEGSAERARLARLRCRDLENVEVVCAPFQELDFVEPFDLVICVGVLEYASLYEDAEDPYGTLLAKMRGLLHEGGALVLAIENQFGLKYFTASPEDHTGIPFDGLEGYPRFSDRARTFGLAELRGRVQQHFAYVADYFPYPDYKLPQCVLANRAFERIGAGELLGAFATAAHDTTKPLFDPRLTLLELERNQQLPFFANSFLLVAGHRAPLPVRMESLATMYSRRGANATQTVTRVYEPKPGEIHVEKTLASGDSTFVDGKLSLRAVESPWLDSHSLDTQLRARVRLRNMSLAEVFAPCRAWLEALPTQAGSDGQSVPGDHVDCIWRNAYPREEGYRFIDLEWTWHAPLRRNTLLLRSIHWFLEGLRGARDLHPELQPRSTWQQARTIAGLLGQSLDARDFEEFLEVEAEFTRATTGIPTLRTRKSLRLKTRSPRTYATLTQAGRLLERVRARLRRLPALARS